MLYTATGLDILVTVSIVAWVIPHMLYEASGANPERSVPLFWLVAAIHLVILALLIKKIWVSRRGGRLRKAGLVIPGVVLVLMSIVLTEAAGIYLEYQPVIYGTAIILFVGAFFDLMTGIILVMLPIRLPDDREGPMSLL